MEKSKILMIALSALSILALGLGFAAFGVGEWFPPGGSIAP